MGVLKKMSPGKGEDELLTWDPEDPEQVEAARKRFNALVHPEKSGHAVGTRSHRFIAARVEYEPRQGEQIDEFDPDASEILLIPAMAGG